MEIGVYVHIPFCRSKCGYCDFNSFSGKENCFKSYINALKNEIAASKELHTSTIKTIFIGGGTPSILPPHYIGEILEALMTNPIADSAEVTIEANPDSLDLKKLLAYKSYGINRLSIGLQAWQDSLLKTLGRPHSRQDFLNCYENALKADFSNISVDLMFGVPEQTAEDWLETIDNVSRLNIKHISCYSLIVEEGTSFYERYSKGQLIIPDEDIDRAMYHNAVKILGEKGFNQYEISNFAKKGYSSKHNTLYWKRGDYIGFGLSAHSLYNNCRFENTSNLEEYIKFCGNPKKIRRNYVELSPKDIMEEFMFLGLRMNEGISTKEFFTLFGKNIIDVYNEAISSNIEKKLLVYDKNSYKLTKTGIDLSNIVMSDFLL